MKHLAFLLGLVLMLASCSEKESEQRSLMIKKTTVTIEVGEEYQISFITGGSTVKVYDLGANPWHLEFKSSDNSVATVSASGTVKARKAGKVRISTSGPGVKPVADITVTVTPKTVSIPMKLASYNIRCNTSSDTGEKAWSTSRKPLVCNLVRQRNFDVCGFVEVTQPSIRNDLKAQLGDVYNFFFCGRNNGSTEGEAVGFGYRKEMFKMVDSGYFWLNSHPERMGEATEWYDPVPEAKYGRSRLAAWGLLEEKSNGARLLFITSHFELNKGMRAGSARLIVEKAKELAIDGVPTFFCGDLNAAPTETTCTGPLSDYFTDSFEEALRAGLPREGNITTYNGYDTSVAKNLEKKRIDYMYYKGDNVVLEKYGAIYDLANGILPSDHYPIYIDIVLKQVKSDLTSSN